MKKNIIILVKLRNLLLMRWGKRQSVLQILTNSFLLCPSPSFWGMKCWTDLAAIYLSGKGLWVLRSSWVNIPHIAWLSFVACWWLTFLSDLPEMTIFNYTCVANRQNIVVNCVNVTEVTHLYYLYASFYNVWPDRHFDLCTIKLYKGQIRCQIDHSFQCSWSIISLLWFF